MNKSKEQADSSPKQPIQLGSQSVAEEPNSEVAKILAELIRLANEALAASDAKTAAAVISENFKKVLHVDRVCVVELSPLLKVLHTSSGSLTENESFFSQVIREMALFFAKQTDADTISFRDTEKLDSYSMLSQFLTTDLKSQILWVPLGDGSNPPIHALWLERWQDVAWKSSEIDFISLNSIFFRKALNRSSKTFFYRISKMSLAALIFIFFGLTMMIPVNSQVVAPSVVIPENPMYVFAPFGGVISDVIVVPGQEVQVGDVLVRYDTKVMEKNLYLARRGVGTALAELERLEGAAYKDMDALAQRPVQQIEVQLARAEVSYVEKLLELAEVKADVAGIVLLDDPDALLGSALQAGQLIMRLADPKETIIELMVPATDINLVSVNSQINVRLDSEPLKRYQATVDNVGFDVIVSSQGVPSVRVEAQWTESTPSIRSGQKGTSRIVGPSTRLGMRLFRKPLIVLWNWFV